MGAVCEDHFSGLGGYNPSTNWPQGSAVSYFMLSHYVTEKAYRLNNIANPPKTNRVWFDDIVIAKEYIGPIHPQP